MVLALCAGAPALAETRTIDDRTGDGAGKADIVRVVVHNDEDRFRAVVRFAVIKPRKAKAWVFFLAKDGTAYSIGRRQNGRQQFVSADSGSDDFTPVSCPRAKVRLQKERRRLKVGFPQSCLGEDAGTLRVAGLTEAAKGYADIDLTRFRKVRRG